MSFISYAQNYEDVTLWRALKDVKNGFYVDVGAHHPVSDSVTKAFYDRGWSGINIEPIKKNYTLFKKQRIRDVNLNLALSSNDDSKLEMFDVVGTGMSTVDPDYAKMYSSTGLKIKKIEVPSSTLAKVLKKYGPKEIHFLKIDVEGAEKAVLEGSDFESFRPWVILLEATEPNSQQTTHHQWENILTKNDYKFVWFDGLNRFYVAKEKHRQLAKKIAQPPNFFDEFIRHETAHYSELSDLKHQQAHELNQRLAELGSEKAELQSELNRTHETSHGLFLEKQKLDAHIVQVEFERDTYSKLRDQLEAEVKSLNVEIHGLFEQRGANITKIDSLETTLNSKEKELTQLNKKIHDYEKQKSLLEEQIKALVEESDRQKRLLEEHIQTLENENSNIKEKSEQLKIETQQEKQGLISQLQHYQNHTALVQGKLEKINSSFSWKLLRPFRSGKRRLKRDVKKLRKVVRSIFRVFNWKLKVKQKKAISVPTTASDDLQIARPLTGSTFADMVAAPLDKGQRTLYYYVDHTILCPVNTGVQRVTRNLAVNLMANGENITFVKWNDDSKSLVLLNHEDLSKLEKWQGPKLSPAERKKYPLVESNIAVEVSNLVFDENWLVVPEVPHITYHSEPVTLDLIMAAKKLGLRSGFVFYDAIPLKLKEFASIAPLHEEYMQHLLLADMIWPISEFSGDDLRAFFQERLLSDESSMPEISVALLPGESTLSERVRSEQVDKKKLILSVGTIEQRKNQLSLVKAFSDLKKKRGEWQLVLVGNVHPEVSEELDTLIASDKSITLKGNLSDEDLKELYKDAAFTVFPSLEEGFGLPIMESLWHGKPCICANFGAMGEIAEGGGCMMIDTSSQKQISTAIEKLIKNAAELEELTAEAQDRKIKNWKEYAQDITKAINGYSDPHKTLGTIYYLVEHTTIFAYNTGIQRVVRGLAKGLIEQGFKVRPVKWDASKNIFKNPSKDELRHLAQWNGPEETKWDNEPLPDYFESNDRFIIPELTVYAGAPNLTCLRQYVERCGLKATWIFYDAIPWKLKQFYSEHWSNEHAKYMQAISEFDQVLAISKHSMDDLKSFLLSTKARTSDIDRRILACELPAEFPSITRRKKIKSASGNQISILCVGSVELRKNHTNLINAFKAAQKKTSKSLKLIIAGGCHLPEEYVNDFRKLVNSTRDLEWIESADDDQLADLYEQCDFSVYPSIEEGFGLPILESLWCCRPVICHFSGAMAEVAEGGGCLTTDTTDVTRLSEAILELANSVDERRKLSNEAISRSFRTWKDYSYDVARYLASLPNAISEAECDPRSLRQISDNKKSRFVNSSRSPKLSICISTYNRAEWLSVGLQSLFRLLPDVSPDIEVVVCDNASEDHTSDIVKPYLEREDFSYYRNRKNVGMLGNLSKTANHARGKYVWILGDDDIIRPGAIERILSTIKNNAGAALIYLNYSYTREEVPSNVKDIDDFLEKGIPIVKSTDDFKGSIAKCSTFNENFFTAIYCLIFRRDHAIQAYSQNTSGRPFSSMLTCIPTTYHVLHKMMHLQAAWIGEPMLVVNMNVSWLKYAPLWILERFPEVYDRAETMGADPKLVDRWRIHSLPGVKHYFKDIFDLDAEGNAAYFSPRRLIGRFKHLDEFQKEITYFVEIYRQAHLNRKPGAEMSVSDVFPAFIEQIENEG